MNNGDVELEKFGNLVGELVCYTVVNFFSVWLFSDCNRKVEKNVMYLFWKWEKFFIVKGKFLELLLLKKVNNICFVLSKEIRKVFLKILKINNVGIKCIWKSKKRWKSLIWWGSRWGNWCFF